MKPGTRLILVCGLPGTGKSTVAQQIAAKTEAFLFSTDVMRKELLEKPGYSAKEREMVYNLLFEMTDQFLESAKNVVLDGTFYKKGLRDKVREIAAKRDSDFRIVEVVCNERTVRERLGKRGDDTASDADFGIYKKIKKEFDPVLERHFVIDSGGDVEKQIANFLKSA